jgi:hypothetical protein
MELGFIIMLALVIPFIVVWPVLIWAGAIKSLYTLIRGRVKEKAVAH